MTTTYGGYPRPTRGDQVIGCITRNLMTHKCRGSIIVISISKSVEPNEDQKVLTSGFQQGFTSKTKRKMFMGFCLFGITSK